MASPIDIYKDKTGNYPGNNKQWWIAKVSVENQDGSKKVGDFDPELLQKFFFGNSRAPRGHFIINAMYVDRSGVSGIPGIPIKDVQSRPTCVAFFSGRVWYGHNSTVYFSQILDNIGKAGNCYQEADPTAEDISDLIATDGGVIQLPEAIHIVKLIPLGNGIVVFATNGVWFISGGTGFTATSFSIVKVNSIGTDAPNSIVEINNGPTTQILWWSKIGIQGMAQSDQASEQLQQLNLTETTIQTFYNDISDAARQNCKGAYDPATNTVQWVYGDLGQLYDKVLCLDLTLGAFYPWKINTDMGDVYMTGIAALPSTIKIPNSTIPANSFIYPIQQGTTISYGYFHDINCADFKVRPYESYMITGYELLEDAMRDKQANYVFTYFNQTEGPWVPVDGEYDLVNKSSCKLQTRWDWSNSAVSNRWSREIEAYRLRDIPIVNEFTTPYLPFDNGYGVVVTKNKVRGHGKSIQYRFACDEIGRNFDLLGWAVNYTGNTKP